MYANIRGMVFLEQLIKDGDSDPDSGGELLQEDDGELSDAAIHFTTKTINDPKDHDISYNISY